MKCYLTSLVKAKHIFAFTLTLILFLTSFNTDVKAQEGKDLFVTCTACHTVGGGKLIGPDLEGVTERRGRAWLIKFIRNSQVLVQSGDETAVALFNEYNKTPMPPNNITDDQVRSLLKYIENYRQETAETTVTETPKTTTEETYGQDFQLHSYLKEAEARNYTIIFMIALVLMVLAIADLFVTRIIKAKFAHVIIILISIFIMGEILVVEAQGLGRQQYYSPDQPIEFSHKVHAGQNKIDCKYCHTTVEDSRHAGIPSVQLCMNCHAVVKNGTKTGTEEISKIYAALESGKPIEWIKVHNVPDHVFFSHAQHVKVGKVDCQQCHGSVETMDRIMQVEDLGMGWCINCHRNTEVQFTSNEFYKDYKKLHEELNTGKSSRITVDNIGGNDCQKCHY